MENDHLQSWFDGEREYTDEERQWLDRLLQPSFEGREILLRQLDVAKVVGYCTCGCRTITIQVPKLIPSFPLDVRVPVEMIAQGDDAIPIVFYLHVIDGYASELEVFRADSAPMTGKIRLEAAVVSVNLPQ